MSSEAKAASEAIDRREYVDPALPEIAVEFLPGCALCGSTAKRELAAGFDYELLTCRNRWHFEECLECRHVQLNPRPHASTLDVIYPRHYYSYDMQKSVGSIALSGKAYLDKRKFRNIIRHSRRTPRSYLDVGCGDGKYLTLMQSFGVQPANLHGLELNDDAVNGARSRGYDVRKERVETAAFEPASIELATMFHVIEHVADPFEVAAKIHDWLAPGGLFVLETPNMDSLDARLFRRGHWGGYHIPRHWHLFTPQTIRAMLEKAGFRVEAIAYQTGHSFWLYSFHHVLRDRVPGVGKFLSRLVHPLRSLPALVAITGFDLLRATLGFKTSAMMVIARRPGELD